MPRSLDEILDQADAFADRFEAYEPTEADRATISPTMAVRLAAMKRAEAERELAAAIAYARESRTSWRTIGELVGTSGEAARQRYGAHVAH
jgi:hypothetical protein